MLRYFVTFNYTTPVFLLDQSVNFFQQMGILIESTLKENDDLVPYRPSNYYQFSSSTIDRQAMAEMLRSTTEFSRVGVICANSDTVRKVMRKVDPIVVHFYETILLYAQVIKLMDAAGTDYLSGRKFTAAVANFSFVSPVTGVVAFIKNSDRLLDYTIRQYNAERHEHDVIMAFPATSQRVTFLGNILWFGAKSFPTNAPFCGFKNENPACKPQPHKEEEANDSVTSSFPPQSKEALSGQYVGTLVSLFVYPEPRHRASPIL
ncbi:hypothetical protein RvY_04065 [Ramazzottius varieornatus]|uniref:Receptor ligand binding region domain-containing protein n=1 Tax=Ramazzottius varieornatus TaxID=947166 RepID=A0A1D1UQ97_RAMVA|nr:hypothetical protein RvY_04065 [Ramazzottius varieornatus]